MAKLQKLLVNSLRAPQLQNQLLCWVPYNRSSLLCSLHACPTAIYLSTNFHTTKSHLLKRPNIKFSNPSSDPSWKILRERFSPRAHRVLSWMEWKEISDILCDSNSLFSLMDGTRQECKYKFLELEWWKQSSVWSVWKIKRTDCTFWIVTLVGIALQQEILQVQIRRSFVKVYKKNVI